MMKKIIEYVPIITFCVVYFGFCNLHYYYKEFNIDIYNYVSNTEILLSFLPSIVLFSSSIYILLYNRIVNHSNSEEIIETDEGTETLKSKKSDLIYKIINSLAVQMLLLIIIEYIISFFLKNIFGFKNHELQFLIILSAIAYSILIYYSSGLFKNTESINNNLLLITIFSVVYIGSQIGNYRILDAEKIKAGIPIKLMEFQYNKRNISTSEQNIYIGQTQSSLFMYNIKDKSTIIYKMENIDSLVFKFKNRIN